MKTERARELYSDYAEGVLSPALRQALEQHFEADPDARADYHEFTQIYQLLDNSEAPMVDVPLGFRAKVLELAAEQQAGRQTHKASAGWLNLRGLFDLQTYVGRRQLMGVLAAGLGVLLIAGIFVYNYNGHGPVTSVMVPSFSGGNQPTTTIQGVSDQIGADGKLTHLFNIHLPSGSSDSTITAYVLTSTDQISDPSLRQQGGIVALQDPVTLSDSQSLQIPVTVTQSVTDDSGLMLFVQWTPVNGGPTRSQVVFTPLESAAPTTPAPTDTTPSGDLYDALQAISQDYGVTVIADATRTPNVSVPSIQPSDNVTADLRSIVGNLHYSVREIDSHTYQVYHN